MKNTLAFDFTVNKESKSITVKKEFAADQNAVWNAWTKAELLDQWWAPLPYKNETISMQFEKGGMWFYAMVSPEGQKHYCKAYYTAVDAQNSFSYRDTFCNEKGEDSTEMPGTNWSNSFNEDNGVTTVTAHLTYASIEALEMIIKMGFKEGFTMGLDQLEQLLSKS
ncbi:MAG: SRPBCC domain-containing protein [Flavobacteriales bacterium]